MGFPEWRLLPLGAILCLLLGRGNAGSSSHSLQYFDMAVWEPGQRTPRFTALVYVNDQQIGRYDRNTGQCVTQSPWIKEIHKENAYFWTRNTEWEFASTLVSDLMVLKNHYNQSREIQTLQVIFGCEMSGDSHTRGFVKYGFNGRDFLSLDVATLTWTVMDAEADPIKRKWDAEEGRQKFWKVFLQVICVEGLRTHLHYGEAALLRKEPPTVKVMRKTGHDRLETLVCRLDGFYPKEIDVTWMKDGEDRKPETQTGGVIPNSDGTYHTWLSIEVDPKEKDHYQCRVEHDSLQKPLELVLESAPDLGLILGIVGGLLAALILVGAGVACYMKKQQENKGYKAASVGVCPEGTF